MFGSGFDFTKVLIVRRLFRRSEIEFLRCGCIPLFGLGKEVCFPDQASPGRSATFCCAPSATSVPDGVRKEECPVQSGVDPTFLGAAAFGVLIFIIVRLVPGLQISIDFTKAVSFESAPVSIFSHSLDPGRLPAPKDGPVSITTEFNVDPARRNECIELMRDARVIFLRNGAHRWHLYEDLTRPNSFRMEVVVPSWKQHLLQSERMTKSEKEVIDNLRALRTNPNPPEEWISLSVEKEVLSKRVRTAGLPPGYVDQ